MYAFSLARVSTPEQRKNASIDTQLAANSTYAKKSGLVIVDEFVDEYSGATLDRAAASEMLRRVRSGEVSHIIIYSLDRLTRDPADFLPLRRELHQQGVSIHISRDERTLSTDPLKDLPDDIAVVIAKHERAQFRERSMRGVRAKVLSGKPIGCGPAPYGYRYEGYKRDRVLVIDEHEAQILQRIFQWYAVGDGNGPLSVANICRNLEGIPTRNDTVGRTKTTAKYGQWNPGSIRAILRNPIYGGRGFAFRKYVPSIGTGAIMRPREEWLPVEAPALISPDLFNLAQERLAKGREQSMRSAKFHYFLRCRIRCTCGYAIVGTINGSGKRNYRCSSGTHSRERCGLPYIPIEIADSNVWQWIHQQILNPDQLMYRLRRLREQANNTVTEVQANEQQKQRQTEIDRKIEQLLDLYLDQQLSRKLLDERLARLQAEREALQQVLQEPRTATMSDQFVHDVYQFSTIIAAGLQGMTVEEQRRVLDMLDLKLVVQRTDLGPVAQASCRLRSGMIRFVVASNHLSYGNR